MSPFIRRVFQHYGPRAQRTGATLLTAFGYDYIPGNLAGVLALAQAADSGFVPTRVDVGYFVPMSASAQRSISGGTLASTLAILSEPGFAWHGGAIHTERPGSSVRSFEVDGRQLDGLSWAAPSTSRSPPSNRACAMSTSTSAGQGRAPEPCHRWGRCSSR